MWRIDKDSGLLFLLLFLFCLVSFGQNNGWPGEGRGSLANEMKKKVKETVKSEFLLRLRLARCLLLLLLLLLPLPTIISWRFFFSFLVFLFILFFVAFLASSSAASVSAAATCAFYLRFVYCLPMIDERISFQVLAFVPVRSGVWM